MTNRYGNFNRKKEKKLKVIRDKKRARIKNKKKSLGVDDNNETELTKKEKIRMKRSEHILKAAGIKDVSEILKKKTIKRRNNKKRKRGEKMEVDE